MLRKRRLERVRGRVGGVLAPTDKTCACGHLIQTKESAHGRAHKESGSIWRRQNVRPSCPPASPI